MFRRGEQSRSLQPKQQTPDQKHRLCSEQHMRIALTLNRDNTTRGPSYLTHTTSANQRSKQVGLIQHQQNKRSKQVCLAQHQQNKRFKQSYLRQLRGTLCRGGGEGGRGGMWQGGSRRRLSMQSTALSCCTGMLLVAVPR